MYLMKIRSRSAQTLALLALLPMTMPVVADPPAAANIARARQDLAEVERAVPNPARGAVVYQTCVECHSPQGPGSAQGWVPEIAGQHARVIKKQLVDYRDGRRWDTAMETIAGRHVLTSAQDIADVASYAASLTPQPPQGVGSGEWLRIGARRYEARCVSCHGETGQGNSVRIVPRVAGQRYEYVLRQLHDSLEGRRPNMAAGHARVLAGLDVTELNGLADYISRLSLSTPHRSARTAGIPPGTASDDDRAPFIRVRYALER